MRKKKRWVWFWVSVCCICFLGFILFSLQGQAAEEVQNVAPATTVYEMFDRYATNSFQLLTKEYSSFTGIKTAVVNISGTFKDLRIVPCFISLVCISTGKATKRWKRL